MPYIKQEDRDKFYWVTPNPLQNVAENCENAGDLNYAITMILKKYMEKKGECYATHNEIIGMLDCCKMEWYRKRVAIYENKKEKENGDV